eukprot:gb/GEZN01004370.1/.p1 GENE.gb/GEZN01004370.1/~~gb/GEZN01004370.1/.p1  ORF type:complete len:495 (+),score=32.39 gb/GEZN01004370.1/:339-1823(+)
MRTKPLVRALLLLTTLLVIQAVCIMYGRTQRFSVWYDGISQHERLLSAAKERRTAAVSFLSHFGGMGPSAAHQDVAALLPVCMDVLNGLELATSCNQSNRPRRKAFSILIAHRQRPANNYLAETVASILYGLSETDRQRVCIQVLKFADCGPPIRIGGPAAADEIPRKLLLDLSEEQCSNFTSALPSIFLDREALNTSRDCAPPKFTAPRVSPGQCVASANVACLLEFGAQVSDYTLWVEDDSIFSTGFLPRLESILSRQSRRAAWTTIKLFETDFWARNWNTECIVASLVLALLMHIPSAQWLCGRNRTSFFCAKPLWFLLLLALCILNLFLLGQQATVGALKAVFFRLTGWQYLDKGHAAMSQTMLFPSLCGDLRLPYISWSLRHCRHVNTPDLLINEVNDFLDLHLPNAAVTEPFVVLPLVGAFETYSIFPPLVNHIGIDSSFITNVNNRKDKLVTTWFKDYQHFWLWEEKVMWKPEQWKFTTSMRPINNN